MCSFISLTVIISWSSRLRLCKKCFPRPEGSLLVPASSKDSRLAISGPSAKAERRSLGNHRWCFVHFSSTSPLRFLLVLVILILPIICSFILLLCPSCRTVTLRPPLFRNVARCCDPPRHPASVALAVCLIYPCSTSISAALDIFPFRQASTLPS